MSKAAEVRQIGKAGLDLFQHDMERVVAMPGMGMITSSRKREKLGRSR